MSNLSVFNQSLTMSSREIAELTGKAHHHVKRDIQAMMIQLEVDVSKFGCIYIDAQNREQTEYLLPKDETICLLSGYDVNARMKIIKRWQELESGLNTLPQSLPDALRLAADLAEQKAIAESERDEAIRTKALIGNKREASAMAKASVLSRKLKKAEEMLGDSANWKTTKAIHWLLDCFENTKPMYQQVGKHLTRLSAIMDREVKKVESTDYGSVKSYHIDVINAFEVQLSSDPELLGKYRKA